jgi:signal transduction histidine kinase
MGKFNPVWMRPQAMLGYAVAFLSVAATLIIAPQIYLQAAPASLFLCAIMFTAWVGGLKAGVLAMLLSVLSFKYYFLAPIRSLALETGEIPRLVVFSLAALFVLAITAAQKRDEEKLHKTGRELRANIEDLNRTQHQLHKAQAELAHVTRLTTMGELTASIAHEVNQPLTAVVNNANACLDLLDPASKRPGESSGASHLKEVREALGEIVDDAERASAVVGRVRQLAKRAPLEKSLLDLKDVVNDVLVLARYESAARRVTIRTELPKDLPPVLGDRVQLQQVLLNLLMNGMDAMSSVEESKRVLKIFGCRETKDGMPAVLLCVQDAGVGLKTEELDRLFEPFYTTKPHGMGMGLAISRSIIEAHGGRLWPEPNKGAGATFSFRVPAVPEPVVEGGSAATAGTAASNAKVL